MAAHGNGNGNGAQQGPGEDPHRDWVVEDPEAMDEDTDVDQPVAADGAPGAAGGQRDQPRQAEPLERQMADMQRRMAVMSEALARVLPRDSPRSRRAMAAEAAAAEKAAEAAAAEKAAATAVAKSQQEAGPSNPSGMRTRPAAELQNPVVPTATRVSTPTQSGGVRQTPNPTLQAILADPTALQQLQEHLGITPTMPQAAVDKPHRPTAPQTRMSDVKIGTFSGNPDPKATNILQSQWSPLLEWVDRAVAAIQRSWLDEDLQAACLIQGLTGAAMSTFHDLHGYNTTGWTIERAADAIAGLVPEHRAHFTMSALQMVFRRYHLATDVRSYANFLKQGETNPEGVVWMYQLLKDKLLAAEPTILSVTGRNHNINLEIRTSRAANAEVRRFDDFVRDAQDLIRQLETEDDRRRRRPREHDESGAGTPAQPIKPKIPKVKKPRVHWQLDRDTGASGADGQQGTGTSAADTALLRQYQRCTKCGMRLGRFTEEAHRASGDYCQPKKLPLRIAALRADIRDGRDPNARRPPGGGKGGKHGQPPGPPRA